MAVRTQVKKMLDAITHPLGINVTRHFGNDNGLKEVCKVFAEKQVNLILDVGANTGQYAKSIFRTGYKGSIISFEPLDDAYEELKKNAATNSNWKVFERCAIGDYDGTTTINISKNSHSSSILPINEQHIKAAPSAEYVDKQSTPIYTLDSIASSIINSSDKVCLKIDTQGFEDKVLSGARSTLKNIELIQLELSLVPLYEGSKTFEWMVPWLKELSFEPLMYFPGFIDRRRDEIQQLEGLFIKVK